MRIRYIIAIIAAILPLIIIAQDEKPNRISLNGGIKIGFHAATYNSTIFNIDSYEYNDRIIQSNKIGYAVAPFIRVNRNRLYLQTEAMLSISRHYFEFIDNSTEEAFASEATENTPQYKLTTYCIQVPLLFGYKFVDSSPYCMSFFTGPKAKFLLTAHDKQEFAHFKYNEMYEELTPTLYYWEFGLDISISNICFDFVYDIGINNHTKGIIAPVEGKQFYSKRSDNILSFSIGIIF